jgi:hypothetical protein
MKLTNQQIALIDETLVLNGFLHMTTYKTRSYRSYCSEIEFIMEENTLSFEENLKLKKWNHN